MNSYLRGQYSQQKIHKQVETNLVMINETFSDNQEVQSRQIILGSAQHPHKILLVYCDGMVDSDRLNRVIFPILSNYFLLSDRRNLSAKLFEETVPMDIQTTERFLEPIIPQVLRGLLVIFVDGIDVAFVLDLSKPPSRQPEEPGTEISVRGPRDGFVEELTTNVALIRKRLPTETLCTEFFTIGVRTQTKVSLLFIRDMIDESILSQVREKISGIHVDAVYTISQLESLMSGSKFFKVPIFAYSGRPDFVVGALLRGRFAIILDGSPTVIMGPSNLPFLFQTAEDGFVPNLFLILQRCLRILGLLTTLLLPGFYIAITTYHQDQIPLVLLGTLATARRGTPFSTPMEAFFMLILFELLREAGFRLPGRLGPSLSIVGGLIIGNAAIDAGLTSAIMLAVTGITGLSIFTIPNQSLAGIIALFRFYILIVSSVLGEFGFLIASFSVLVLLSTIRSFGVPYLSPFSPFHARSMLYTFFDGTSRKKQKQSTILRTKDEEQQ